MHATSYMWLAASGDKATSRTSPVFAVHPKRGATSARVNVFARSSLTLISVVHSFSSHICASWRAFGCVKKLSGCFWNIHSSSTHFCEQPRKPGYTRLAQSRTKKDGNNLCFFFLSCSAHFICV